MNTEDRNEIIAYCIKNQLINVKELAAATKFGQATWYGKLKKLNINYKEEITIPIMYTKVKEEEHKKWLKSCEGIGEDAEALNNNNWVWYMDSERLQIGEDGVRRSVTTKYYKNMPYTVYRAIPDTVEDEYVETFKTCTEFKYVVICPEGNRWHCDKLKPLCERLGINYQAAKDCARGKTVKTAYDWVVKKTVEYYA